MRSISILVAMAVVWLMPLEAGAAEFPEYDGEGFQALYAYAVSNTLPDLDPSRDRQPITGDQDLDDRIWRAAFERGYRLQPIASSELVSIGGVPMQPGPAGAWEGLRAEAREAGMAFTVSSAYRSPSSQLTQFLSKLEGTSDAAIDAALRWYSLPGTSKHHAGYALDFRYPSGTFGEFRSTPDYAWLAADNFAIPKRYGLIPSYPDDVENQGPNPEPWEFVWVSTGLIRCGIPQLIDSVVQGPAEAIVDDIGRCPGGMDAPALPGWLG